MTTFEKVIGACGRYVTEFLTTLESYRWNLALSGGRSETSNFMSLSSIVVTSGETSEALYIDDICDLDRPYDLLVPWTVNMEPEMRRALEWACHGKGVGRDLKSIRIYGMLYGVDFWYALTHYPTDPRPLSSDCLGDVLKNIEVIHLDIVHSADLHTICDLARRGVLRKLRKFSFIFYRENRFNESLYRFINKREWLRNNNRLENVSSNVSYFVSVRELRDGCPHLEELGDMRSWNREIINDFVDSTCDGHWNTSLPNGEKTCSWSSLRTLDIGALRSHICSISTEHYRLWMDLQLVWSENQFRQLVDRGEDEETEAAHFTLISILSADVFPSLEEIILVSQNNLDAFDISQFFYCWVTYIFYVKLMHLYEKSSPSYKDEIARKTPRIIIFKDYLSRQAKWFGRLPVSKTVRKLRIVSSQLYDLYDDSDDLSFNEDFLQDNRGTASFLSMERWREMMAWLRVKERHHPEIFPLAIFPNLDEIESNCGLPCKDFAAFLKGSQSQPQNVCIPSMKVYAGALADNTLSALLQHNLLINVDNFEILPDMGATFGYLTYISESLDCSSPEKRAIFRILRTCLPAGPLMETSNPSYSEHYGFTPLQCNSGPLMSLLEGSDEEISSITMNWCYDAPAANGPFRAHQPILLDEISPETVGAVVKLIVPETLHDLLALANSNEVQTFNMVWMTGFKNGCFVNTRAISVPDWIFGDLCCSFSFINTQNGRFLGVFPFDRSLYKSERDGYVSGSKITLNRSRKRGPNSRIFTNVLSMEAMLASVTRRVAQLFCHAPSLKKLTITTIPWSGRFNFGAGYHRCFSDRGHGFENEDYCSNSSDEDPLGSLSRLQCGTMRRLRDSKWSEAKRDYVIYSLQALIEAVCQLRFLASQDPSYLSRSRDEPYVPDCVKYGEVDSQASPLPLPVALGELQCLELNVLAGHAHIYADLRERLLKTRFEGVSGTTLPCKCKPPNKDDADRIEYKVKDAFTGGYCIPELGDEVQERMVKIIVSHGTREQTSIFVWKNRRADIYV